MGVKGPPRSKAMSPQSGVRAAMFPSASPRLSPLPPVPQPPVPTPQPYLPPRPAFDSEGSLTRVDAPDSTLLAIARGENPSRRGPSVGWFVVGVLAGAIAVWLATGGAPGDVYRARVWIADELRALHSHLSEAPSPAPAPTAARSAPSSSAAAAPNIPVVNVSDLPRSPTPAAPAASATSPAVASPTSVAAPPALTPPSTLVNPPGPR